MGWKSKIKKAVKKTVGQVNTDSQQNEYLGYVEGLDPAYFNEFANNNSKVFRIRKYDKQFKNSQKFGELLNLITTSKVSVERNLNSVEPYIRPILEECVRTPLIEDVSSTFNFTVFVTQKATFESWLNENGIAHRSPDVPEDGYDFVRTFEVTDPRCTVNVWYSNGSRHVNPRVIPCSGAGDTTCLVAGYVTFTSQRVKYYYYRYKSIRDIISQITN